MRRTHIFHFAVSELKIESKLPVSWVKEASFYSESIIIYVMEKFKLVSHFKPSGDQPDAIRQLTAGLSGGKRHQVLLGVTGSGKTFTMANVIAALNRPTLVISPNKILAAQLYAEFKQFFPGNAVEYFISYYDYYQPEAYVPQSDTYIEKDASINDHIDRLRLKATSSLLERQDVIIVASVSCIYGLGSPKDYKEMCVFLEKGKEKSREVILQELVSIHYERKEVDFSRGKFRVKGDTVEIFPAYLETALRTCKSLSEKNSAKSSARRLVSVVTSTRSFFFTQALISPRRWSICP